MAFSFNPGKEQIETKEDSPLGDPYVNRGVDGGGLFYVLSVTIFFGVIVVIGLSFGYKYYLENVIQNKKAKLAMYDQKILKGVELEEVKSLSNRIKVSTKLVDEHPFVSTAFKLLEGGAEDTVIYSQLDIRSNDQTGIYGFDISGTAPDYKSVARQIDVIKSKPYSDYISSVEVKSLSPDKTGKVTFALHTNVRIKDVKPESVRIDSSSSSAQQGGSVEPTSLQVPVSTTTKTVTFKTPTTPVAPAKTQTSSPKPNGAGSPPSVPPESAPSVPLPIMYTP